MTEITVRTAVGGSLQTYEFAGPHLHYRIDSQGNLSVFNWEKDDREGSHSFPPGVWFSVRQSRPLGKPQIVIAQTQGE
jgi:hypothetical protein